MLAAHKMQLLSHWYTCDVILKTVAASCAHVGILAAFAKVVDLLLKEALLLLLLLLSLLLLLWLTKRTRWQRKQHPG